MIATLTPWLAAFTLTQAIEMPIYLAKPLRRRVAVAFGASALTHPIVWWVLPVLWLRVGLPSWTRGDLLALQPAAVVAWAAFILYVEGFAVIVEGLYFKLLGVRHPFRWSFIANLASYSVGALLSLLFEAF